MSRLTVYCMFLAASLLPVLGWTHRPEAGERDLIEVSTTPVPAASVALVGTWKLMRLETHPDFQPLAATPELIFDEAGRFTGSTGCNRLFGAYQISGSSLKISGVATTRMACKGDAGQIEQAFLAMLNAVAAWTRNGTLEFVDEDGERLATFE